MITFTKTLIKKIFNLLGYEIQKKRILTKKSRIDKIFISSTKKIHYGCGLTLLNGWLNVDLFPAKDKDHISISVDLIGPHPFPDNWFEFGFSEDFIEHLSQDESIIFLSEVYRTFKPGSVLRLSFPGLEGVLETHYRKQNYEGAFTFKKEAYAMWGHIHFYSKEELSLVCRHIGFREINPVEYGKSAFNALNDLDTRKGQIGVNTYVEIKK